MRVADGQKTGRGGMGEAQGHGLAPCSGEGVCGRIAQNRGIEPVRHDQAGILGG